MATKTKSLIMVSGGFSLRGLAAFLAVALLLLSAITVTAQERSGNIAGVVKDQSGGVLPGVAITLTNKASNRIVSTKTDASGAYVARELEPGRYTVKFELTGFSNAVVQDVILLLEKTIDVNATMQIGAVEQVVEVTGAATLIDTTSTVVAHNVTAEEFDRLPKARSFQGLALSSPSVNSGDVEGGFQVNGASGAENQFNIDGISTSSVIDGRSRQNAVYEYLQEVQVKTGGLEAEYGGALGGVISAVTKSGGNAFHGEGHYFLSGNKLNAGPVRRLLLNPVDDQTVSFVQDSKFKDNRNELGGSLGGYIVRNKLYFYSSLSPQWRRRSNNYQFKLGTEPDTLSQETLFMTMFNKLSFDPTNRIRTNFSWLYTPTASTGRLPAYSHLGNQVVSDKASNQINKQVGFFAPQASYTGNVDISLSNSSLLGVRGGYFWDNYKDSGIAGLSSVTYQTSTSGVPFEAQIPVNLPGGIGFQNTPRLQNTFYDLTTRGHIEVNFSQTGNFLGNHNVKVGTGTQKIINKVDNSYPGGGYVYIFWDRAFRSNATGLTQRGAYGYYEVDDIGTKGSTGANITYFYLQDQWRVHPRLTLSLGLRDEKERIPSFRRDIGDFAFKFGFRDKISPRVGASFDLLGNGKLVVKGSWGRYFDWVKYELSRGTFGGDYWRVRYRALDTLDVFSLSGTNMPGKNLWTDAPNSFRDRRVPAFDTVAPGIKPMSTDLLNFGVEYELAPQMVFSGRYVRNDLRRTIEDLGVLVGGDEVYYYANPGEGAATITAPSGATKPFPTPKTKRTYDAMELSITRRFSNGWFGYASYVYSRLYGNYAGLASSDEITTPTTGFSSTSTQQQGGNVFRAGGSGNRAWDIDEVLWDARGTLDVRGRLATDRPHVVKLYGGHNFKKGTELGALFYGGSGTPLTTYVVTVNQTEVMVNGRGDMGRTPVLTQADFVAAHEVKMGEGKRLRFEFNALNLFNQKISRHRFNSLNRPQALRRQSAYIDLHGIDLAKGYDYRSLLLNQTTEGAKSFDPRYGLDDLFNTGFAGRFMVKFIF